MRNYIATAYGSKRGCWRYMYYGIKDWLFGEYRRYGHVPSQVSRVVFVCKGNICRSAAAEVFFKDVSDFPCVSLGLDTTSGNAANDRVIEIVKDFGVSLDEHRTTAIKDFQAQQGDIYVCMEPDHIFQLEKWVGSVSNIALLGKFGNPNNVYIHDPYNSNNEYAQACIKYIYEAVRKLSHQVADLNENGADVSRRNST
jgi:protein-tyrosine-phosphatase